MAAGEQSKETQKATKIIMAVRDAEPLGEPIPLGAERRADGSERSDLERLVDVDAVDGTTGCAGDTAYGEPPEEEQASRLEDRAPEGIEDERERALWALGFLQGRKAAAESGVVHGVALAVCKGDAGAVEVVVAALRALAEREPLADVAALYEVPEQTLRDRVAKLSEVMQAGGLAAIAMVQE
jgi:hypothetical protein